MSELPHVGLNPAARPVDTFAAPEVRMDDAVADGHTLGEIAQALSQFNGSLQTVADRWIMAGNERQQERGYIDGMRTKNQAAWSAAVARGDIKESDNPWYIEGIKTSWAKVQAREAVQKFQVWYDSDPEAAGIRAADDPTVVDAAIDEKIGPILRDFNAHQISATLPELQNFKSSFIQAHLGRRSQERTLEREQLYGIVQRSNVSGVTAGMTALHAVEGDAHAGDMIDEAAGTVQSNLDDALLSMDRSSALKVTVGAIFDQAEHNADPRLARALLSRVRSDGRPLSDLYGPQLDNHEARMDQLMVHRWNQQNAAQSQLLKEQTESFLAGAIQQTPAAWAGLINSAPPQLQANIANKLNEFGKDMEGITSTAAEANVRASVLTSLGQGKVPTTAEWLNPKGPFMLYSLVKSPKEYMGLLDQSKWPKETSPEIFMEVTDAIKRNSGVLPYEHLQSLIKAGKVSESDADKWIKLAPGFNDKNPLTPFLGAIGRGDDIISGLVVGGMLKNGDLDFKDSTTSAQVTTKMTQARHEYQRKAEEYVLKNGSTMDPKALSEGLTGLAEQAAEAASGISLTELKAMNDETIRGRKYAEYVGSNTPAALGDIAAHPSKSNTFTVKGFGVEVGFAELPLLFTDASNFNDARARTAIFGRLGLSQTKDQKRFLDLQLKKLKDAGLSR